MHRKQPFAEFGDEIVTLIACRLLEQDDSNYDARRRARELLTDLGLNGFRFVKDESAVDAPARSGELVQPNQS